MSRALHLGLALLLGGWLALAGAPATLAAGPKLPTPPPPPSRGARLEPGHHRAPAEVTVVALTHRGHERTGNHFRADRVRSLKIVVEWRTLVGAHTQQLELITPAGSIYQRVTGPVASATGRARVETQVPVAGSWIARHSLEGQWEVKVYLDEAVTPLATATFTLAK